jgi:TrmH family RNA methyltransferase
VITSTRNPKIQWARKLQSQARFRKQEKLLVVEGVRLVEEAALSGWPVRLVLHTEVLSERAQVLIGRFEEAGCDIEAVSESVLASASDTETPQGILVVVEQQALALPTVLDFVVILDGVRDPGNAGTILRTAAAAGVQAVIFAPGSVDPYSPKVLRSAMGAHFRLPVLSLDWDEIERLVKPDLQVFLADSSAGQVYTTTDLTRPLALVIGGEASGAGGAALELGDLRLKIPMAGEVESLNAAAAAAVLLFEIVRQRVNVKG